MSTLLSSANVAPSDPTKSKITNLETEISKLEQRLATKQVVDKVSDEKLAQIVKQAREEWDREHLKQNTELAQKLNSLAARELEIARKAAEIIAAQSEVQSERLELQSFSESLRIRENRAQLSEDRARELSDKTKALADESERLLERISALKFMSAEKILELIIEDAELGLHVMGQAARVLNELR